MIAAIFNVKCSIMISKVGQKVAYFCRHNVEDQTVSFYYPEVCSTFMKSAPPVSHLVYGYQSGQFKNCPDNSKTVQTI